MIGLTKYLRRANYLNKYFGESQINQKPRVFSSKFISEIRLDCTSFDFQLLEINFLFFSSRLQCIGTNVIMSQALITLFLLCYKLWTGDFHLPNTNCIAYCITFIDQSQMNPFCYHECNHISRHTVHLQPVLSLSSRWRQYVTMLTYLIYLICLI